MEQQGQPQPISPNPLPELPKTKKNIISWVYMGIVVLLAAAAFGVIWWFAQATNEQAALIEKNQPQYSAPAKSKEAPKLASEQVLTNLDHVWEITFLPTKEMLFTQRKGTLSMLKDGNIKLIANVEDVHAEGEGGMLGMTLDPGFTANRQIYLCFNSSKEGRDVRIVRWRLNDDLSGLDQRKDIVTGITANSAGRHSGCRLAFGLDGFLWIATGDAATGDNSILPKDLAGKVLRVDREGQAALDNGLGADYDARIYSYGHRNLQGLAFYKSPVNGVLGVTVEHGSSVDDEVNLLQRGNFGWAPAKGYNESGVPMTDKVRFPDAIEAIWSSGNPTQAPSGATFVKGRQWKAWDGALVVAMLKTEQLKILTIENNKVAKEEKAFEGTFGRIRTAVQGPDGNLYIGTDNGGNDQIVRIIPN